MSDIAVVRSVSSDELRDWRQRGANEGRRRSRYHYGVSPGARSNAPKLAPNEDGSATIGADPLPAPAEGREVADRMEARRHRYLQRVMAMGPEGKLRLVQHLRQTNPALLADYPDDGEAVAHLNLLIRREAQQVAERALLRQGRAGTVIY